MLSASIAVYRAQAELQDDKCHSAGDGAPQFADLRSPCHTGGERPQRSRIDYFNPFASELERARGFESIEEARDDLADGAELISQFLVSCVNDPTVAQEIVREPFVQPMEGHRVNNGHKVPEPVGKYAKHELAKRRVSCPLIKESGRKHRQSSSDHSGTLCAQRSTGQKTRGRHNAHLTGHHSIEFQSAPVARAARNLNFPLEYQRKAGARHSRIKQAGSGGHLKN